MVCVSVLERELCDGVRLGLGARWWWWWHTHVLDTSAAGLSLSDRGSLHRKYMVLTMYSGSGWDRHTRPLADLVYAAGRPYFQGVETIPEHPHLLVVPATSVAQWINQIKVFFARGNIEVYAFPTAAADQKLFWEGEHSSWAKSTMRLTHRIIVMAHSVRIFRYYSSSIYINFLF
jgi:hypothetical protein